MSERQDISCVVNQKLCHTCGACAAICPSDAISYQETVGGYCFPTIEKEKCVQDRVCRFGHHGSHGAGRSSSPSRLSCDIVAGDPWGIEGIDRQKGESIAIVRSERGQLFFKQFLESQCASCREIPYHDILTGQKNRNEAQRMAAFYGCLEGIGTTTSRLWIRNAHSSGSAGRARFETPE